MGSICQNTQLISMVIVEGEGRSIDFTKGTCTLKGTPATVKPPLSGKGMTW
jgi:hypothetical protein